jgi:hypothetical protein
LSFDFITFDDGEVPLEELITNIEDPNYNSYKRTFLLEDGKVVYKNNLKQDYKQPNLEHLIILICKYISVIEIVNQCTVCGVMALEQTHMAHGCYWGNVLLRYFVDYIKIYEPIAASLL